MRVLLIALAVLCVAAAAALGWVVLRGRLRGRSARLTTDRARAEVDALIQAAEFPVTLGDVVVLEDDRLKLRGAWLLLQQGSVVAAIWHSEHGPVITFRRSTGIFRTEAVEIRLPNDPPAVLELDDELYARYDQMRVKVLPVGHPDGKVRSRGLFVEYTNVGRRSFFALSDGKLTLAWKVRRVQPSAVVRTSTVPPKPARS
ncbi:MAG TPA: hypothetical protein VGJ84_15350 [Polyangiaceae bacterium]|jgi:hypothetical protein